MAYKILNGDLILEPDLMPKMQFQRPIRGCNQPKVGSDNELKEPQSDLDVAGKTFFYATPRIWNHTISSSQANAPSVEAFKRYFKK